MFNHQESLHFSERIRSGQVKGPILCQNKKDFYSGGRNTHFRLLGPSGSLFRFL